MRAMDEKLTHCSRCEEPLWLEGDDVLSGLCPECDAEAFHTFMNYVCDELEKRELHPADAEFAHSYANWINGGSR